MSKGTIRVPESAVTNGRVGTARIREEVAGAAARLASTEAAPLDRAVRSLAGLAGLDEAFDAPPGHAGKVDAIRAREMAAGAHLIAASPVERMQRLGRLGTGRMNKTEAAYAETLAARLHIGEVLWFRFEAHKLRLADNTFYTPDFSVIVADGALEYHEVKGHWTDKARVKTKTAAAQFPHRFIAVKRAGRHGWQFEDMTSKSW